MVDLEADAMESGAATSLLKQQAGFCTRMLTGHQLSSVWIYATKMRIVDFVARTMCFAGFPCVRKGQGSNGSEGGGGR